MTGSVERRRRGIERGPARRDGRRPNPSHGPEKRYRDMKDRPPGNMIANCSDQGCTCEILTFQQEQGAGQKQGYGPNRHGHVRVKMKQRTHDQ